MKKFWKGAAMMAAVLVCLMFQSIVCFAGTDLKINPEAFRNLKDSEFGYSGVVPMDKFFIGLEEEGCTVRELHESLKKYPSFSPYWVYDDTGETEIFSEKDGALEFYLGEVLVEIWPTVEIDRTKNWEETVKNLYTTKITLNGETIWSKQVDMSISSITWNEETHNWDKNVSWSDIEAIITEIEIVNAASEVEKSGWVEENDKWYYYENNMAVTGVKDIDGYVYYFWPDDASMAESSFVEVNGDTFYFDDAGHGGVTGWQFLPKNGVDSWHWFWGDGHMAKGWVEIEGYWYYFKPEDGTMVHSTPYTVDGVTYYFNTDGHMLTGWQQIDNEWKYLNSGSGISGYKEGQEVPRDYIMNYIRSNNAGDVIGSYTFAVNFIDDLSGWDKFNHSLKNWKDALKSIFVGSLTTNGDAQTITDAYMNDTNGTVAYMRKVIGSICSNEDLKLMSGADKQVLSGIQIAAKTLGLDPLADVERNHLAMNDTLEQGYRILQDYSQNLVILNHVKELSPEGSVFRTTVEALAKDYENAFLSEMENEIEKTGEKLFTKGADKLFGSKFGTVDKFIQFYYQDTPDIDAIDSVIYSATLRAQAITTLRSTQEWVIATGSDEDLADFISIFTVAKGITEQQYESMLNYYTEKGASKYQAEISFLENCIAKLDAMNFMELLPSDSFNG